ncbi:hypothetical protein FRC00_013552 [Tulasnella sp. 408]|nr:hypothetical protein FRC00_013552 [Tulasnella sp. 408]
MGPSPLVTGWRPSSTYVCHRVTINQLSQELIVIILHLCLGSEKRAKVRTRLTLVCRIWKAIVEGTPSFWTLIEAADGLQHARNAITKTGESPINLILNLGDPVPIDQYLAVVSKKVSQWRSVDLTFDGAFPASFSGLKASTCHSLEKLSLRWYNFGLTPTPPLTLFDGGPAPDALKDISFHGIPADLASMRLSQLSSLVLTPPYVEMDDLLLIFRNSPTLTTLHLQGCGSLRPSSGVKLPITLGSLKACHFDLSIPLIRFLLSAIHAPSLDRLGLALDDSSPDSSIFTPPVSGLEPIIQRILLTAKHIELEFGDPYASITFGGLKFVLLSSNTERFQYLRDVLDSLMDYSGEKRKDLKVRLHLSAVDPTLQELQIFNRSPMVERLVLTAKFWSISTPINAIEALGTCISAGPHGWLFPELKVLEWNGIAGKFRKLETALEKRYCTAQSTQQAYSDQHQHPRSLKELRFFSNNGLFTRSVDLERARRFHRLTGGAKVFVDNALLVDFDTPES